MLAQEFINSVGRESIETAVGVGKKSVYAAYSKEQFPASWYDALDALAKERGVTISRDAFNWKHAETAA